MSIFALKMTGLVLMVLDHIGYYFPAAPVWLRWLGRMVYPLFLFCMVQGYHHTRSRRRYLLRLYIMSLFMTGFGLALDSWFPSARGYGNHNIFLPLLLVGWCVSILETFPKDPRRGGTLLAALGAVQLLNRALPWLVPAARTVSGDVLTGLAPSLAVNEYGFEFVALGVSMYFLGDRRERLAGVYLLFCLYQFSLGDGPQWMMVLALPLLLRYNGERGRSWKGFFYAFYPAHTALLFLLSRGQ